MFSYTLFAGRKVFLLMKSDIYCRARLHSNAAAAGEGRHAKNKGNSSANAIFPMFVSVVAEGHTTISSRLYMVEDVFTLDLL